MGNKKPTCPIWGTTVACKHLDPDKMNFFVEGSLRVGGDYEITEEAQEAVGTLDPKHKAKLTTTLIELRKAGDPAPLVTSDLVEKTKMQALFLCMCEPRDSFDTWSTGRYPLDNRFEITSS